MTGFFSSDALAELAPGLATYIASSEEPLRLIVSPFLRAEDLTAIQDGVKTHADVLSNHLIPMLMTEDDIAGHALRCLSYLLRVGRLELKIAISRRGMFHPKVWLFERAGRTLGIHGSSNATNAGLRSNFEQVSVARSWQDPNQRYITEKLQFTFRRLWENIEDGCEVVTATDALRRSLIEVFNGEAPTEEQLLSLYARAAVGTGADRGVDTPDSGKAEPEASVFQIPKYLRYEDGPFAHQGAAVTAWCEAGFRGVLEMATGSGKTITSMVAAYKLHKEVGPLLIVVAAPYVPLISQWCEEIGEFGLRPINLTEAAGAAQRARLLQRAGRRLRLGVSTAEAVVVSHATLCTAEFVQAVGNIDCARLLIADEAHNLGRPSFTSLSPKCFDYRLALSATPEREYDPEGTQALYAYFGPVVFTFTLEQAIGHCLVEYDYYVHPVYLTEEEMDQWRAISHRIRQNAWRAEAGRTDDFLNKLFRDRRLLLEMAENKLEALRLLLDSEDVRSLRYTLIYASDKGPTQLERVNDMLHQRGVLFHQLTAEETANRIQTTRIIESFREGEIRVVTAKRVLDEGVNIPQICRAYVLASTTVGRQWIQRRGRLLRTCESIGKTHSVIHDFIALPPIDEGGLDQDARSLIHSELRRVQEFARLARNAGRDDGPLVTVRQMVDMAFVDGGGAGWQ
jgi:superfamily II DNA or RNA helicase